MRLVRAIRQFQQHVEIAEPGSLTIVASSMTSASPVHALFFCRTLGSPFVLIEMYRYVFCCCCYIMAPAREGGQWASSSVVYRTGNCLPCGTTAGSKNKGVPRLFGVFFVLPQRAWVAGNKSTQVRCQGDGLAELAHIRAYTWYSRCYA